MKKMMSYKSEEGITILKVQESVDVLISSNGSKTLSVLKPGFGETEQSIIWKNIIASYELPPEFIKTYETFDHQVSKIL
ncbi:hypothetical protein ES705_37840 [subsurface metagenome]